MEWPRQVHCTMSSTAVLQAHSASVHKAVSAYFSTSWYYHPDG